VSLPHFLPLLLCTGYMLQWSEIMCHLNILRKFNFIRWSNLFL
jgi:hypothetical protein